MQHVVIFCEHNCYYTCFEPWITIQKELFFEGEIVCLLHRIPFTLESVTCQSYC